MARSLQNLHSIASLEKKSELKTQTGQSGKKERKTERKKDRKKERRKKNKKDQSVT